MTLALSIKHLSKKYQNGPEALSNVSLDVPQGQFLGLLGPNGAGKTTLIGIMTSLVTKSEGSVSILGSDIDVDFPLAKMQMGVMPQEFNFGYFETVLSVVTFQGRLYGIPKDIVLERAEKYLKQLDLWEKRHAKVSALSGGMKRRLMIARAMVNEPKLLILDEPTAGVDIDLRRSMWAFLQELNQQGTTIILTTHYLEEAEYLCERIVIINHGKLIEDSPKKDLISRLDRETLVLDLQWPCDQVPEISGFEMRWVDATTLEVDIEKGTSLNQVFETLSENNITVTSLRNKSNRLEELFVHLIQE